jgi:hypothetical protein
MQKRNDLEGFAGHTRIGTTAINLPALSRVVTHRAVEVKLLVSEKLSEKTLQ